MVSASWRERNVREVNADDGAMDALSGPYSPDKATALKAFNFDRSGLAARGMGYERLEQLVFDRLMWER